MATENYNSRNPGKILLDKVSIEVARRLESSLHKKTRLIIDQDEDHTQVESPWEWEVKIGSQPSIRLPKRTNITTIYDREDVNGRLLILGAPGAGKTTTLLELAQELVSRTKDDPSQPIPVLLALTSWKKSQNLVDWLVSELQSKYGIRRNIGKQWLKDGKIIPLLDGLDELAYGRRQENCVQKINQFLQSDSWQKPLVVCSRTQEYQLYQTKLGLNNAVILQPLETEQIREYVLQTEGQELWHSISSDVQVMELARTPLLLNVIILAAQEISFEQWQEFSSSQERISYLFEAYISRMLSRPYRGQQPKHQDTRRWLKWLAQKLIEQNETEFFIEKMQPSLLKTKGQRWVFKLLAVLMVGLITGLIFGLITGLLGMMLSFHYLPTSDNIETFEAVQFSIAKTGDNLIFRLIYSLISGLIVGLAYGLIPGIIYGVIVGLISMLVRSPIKTKAFPNQGIWQSVITIGFVAIWFSSFMITAFCLRVWIGEVDSNLAITIFVGLLFGLLMGAVGFGVFVIPYLSLRLVLWWFGRGDIPWNYTDFLNYATNRLFLQRVGVGYRFIHDLLRQHFANQPLSGLSSNHPRR
ncbi:MAG: NACHT domain-containing protein [Symploca sp. SIO2E6]|nr:NACHT domain-containing protein [Symploca sp. SIO2E6]